MALKISMKLVGGINSLCLSERKADVHFKMPYCLKNPNGTKCIPAHTFILTEVSPPFEAMFSGNWIEANGGGVIELPDVVVEAFEKLMAYVYKGEVEFSSMDIDLVVGLYYAAKKYEVTELVELCMAHLLSDLKAKDAFTVLEYCLGKDEPVLRERALQLIHDFSKEALESLAFFNASHAAVQLVYLQNPHSVSEIFLFKAVYKWAKHQCDGSEESEKLRLELGPILNLIRFSTMDHFEFCRDVATTHLLTEAEGYSILLNIGRIELQDKQVLVPLALKIANSQLALPPCSKWSNGVQAYGYDWKLNIQLFDAKGVLAVAGTHPKYLGCYLHMLSIEGAAGRRGGKDKRRFHVDARFRIIKHNGEEVDSYSCTGGLVRSFTHTFASGDANTGFGWQLFATCEELLDPKNGYLSTDEDRSLELVAKVVIKKTVPPPPPEAMNGGA